jgi:hypothetical protein
MFFSVSSVARAKDECPVPVDGTFGTSPPAPPALNPPPPCPEPGLSPAPTFPGAGIYPARRR